MSESPKRDNPSPGKAGGDADADYPPMDFRLFPPPRVVVFLATVLVVIAVLLMSAPRLGSALFGGSVGLSPPLLFSDSNDGIGVYRRLSPLFTHVLVHQHPVHLALNGLSLLIFGPLIARKFSAGRFLLFFVVSGAAGGFLYAMFNAAEASPLIGASGSIAGLVGGLSRWDLDTLRTMSPANKVYRNLPYSIFVWSIVAICADATMGTFFPSLYNLGEVVVAWQAHIGGYLFGLIAFPLFDRRA